MVLTARASGLDPSAAERVFGYRQATQVIEAGLREGGATEACTSAEVASRPGPLRLLLGVLIAGAHVSTKRASCKKT